MQAIRLKEYGKLVIEKVPIPVLGESQVLIRVGYASICGTDQHILKGEMHPRTKLPFTPGHEFSGRVEETGKLVKNWKKGDHVAVDPIMWCGQCRACKIGHYPACTCLKLLGVDMDGGFAEYVAADETMLYKVPQSISDRDSALVEVYSIGFHACRRAGVQKNDSVAIYGAGKIGQVILQAVRTITNGPVFIVDILENRLKIAKDNYQNVTAINAIIDDPLKVIQELSEGNGVDVAFEAVGHAVQIANRLNPVHSCIKSIRGAGTVCVLGLSNEMSPVLMKDLIWREAKIVASRVNHGEYPQVIDHLGAGHLKPETLISAELDISEAMRAFQLLADQPENYIKILLKI